MPRLRVHISGSPQLARRLRHGPRVLLLAVVAGAAIAWAKLRNAMLQQTRLMHSWQTLRLGRSPDLAESMFIYSTDTALSAPHHSISYPEPKIPLKARAPPYGRILGDAAPYVPHFVLVALHLPVLCS